MSSASFTAERLRYVGHAQHRHLLPMEQAHLALFVEQVAEQPDAAAHAQHVVRRVRVRSVKV